MKGNTGPAELADDDLHRLRAMPPLRRLSGRNWTKADILVHRWHDTTVAIKDYAARPLAVRQTLGRWLVRREVVAFRCAAGVAGLPRFLGRSGPFALATEWIEARPLASFGHEPPPRGWDDALAAVVAELHRRGIALGDLHHRDVLIGPNGEVHVVDLATSWILGRRPGRLRRLVFERLREQDLVAVARLRARLAGEDVEAAIRAVGPRAAAWHRRGRRVKRWLNRLRGKARPLP